MAFYNETGNREPLYVVQVQAPSSTDVVIANGEADSASIDMSDQPPRGIAVLVPGAWTAADIGFEVSSDDSTWYPLQNDTGGLVKITGITTDAAGYYVAPAGTWAIGGWQYMRLNSLDTGDETAENQGAARTMTVVFLM